MVWPIRHRQGLRKACGLAAATHSFRMAGVLWSLQVEAGVPEDTNKTALGTIPVRIGLNLAKPQLL